MMSCCILGDISFEGSYSKSISSWRRDEQLTYIIYHMPNGAHLLSSTSTLLPCVILSRIIKHSGGISHVGTNSSH